ncbi:tetratricopeptide repeat protein [Azonexus sp.]|uniref:tetratricopeptide repeat protein n=2 Tax=Azonexus sp. TaxID=1872668 RepID=UPI0035B18142
MRHLALVLACAALSGCATQYPPLPDTATCGNGDEAGTNTRLTMIRRVLDSDQPYAALAHLDASGSRGPGADLLRADILRRLDRGNEAAALYRGLLSTCMVGAGHHGLGLLSGQQGNLPESLKHFRQARLAQPADPRIRSDYGYALLLSGDREAARVEFMTALELAPDHRKAALNLALLHHLNGDPSRGDALARHHNASPEELSALRREAAKLARQPGDNR